MLSVTVLLMLPAICFGNTPEGTEDVIEQIDKNDLDEYDLTLGDVVIGDKASLNSLIWPEPVLEGDTDNDGLSESVCFWLDWRDNLGMCLIADFDKYDSQCSGGDEIILLPIDNLYTEDQTIKIKVVTHDFDSDGIMEYIIFVIDDFYYTHFFVIRTNGHGISPCKSRLKNFFELVGSGAVFEPYIHDDMITGRKAFTGYYYDEWIYRDGRLRQLSDK